jgi:hypothetical protein
MVGTGEKDKKSPAKEPATPLKPPVSAFDSETPPSGNVKGQFYCECFFSTILFSYTIHAPGFVKRDRRNRLNYFGTSAGILVSAPLKPNNDEMAFDKFIKDWLKQNKDKWRNAH